MEIHTHNNNSLLKMYFSEVHINGTTVNGSIDNTGVVGQTLDLSICVTNTSAAPLPPLHLRITTFQDHQNGHHNYRLDAKMAATGATKLIIPEVIYYVFVMLILKYFQITPVTKIYLILRFL